MASIVGRRQGRQTYYYLVESARVNGQPRIVSQRYLGSAAEVVAKLSGQTLDGPVRSQHKKFGDLAAVWSVLDDLDMAGVVDAVVPRRVDAAASVGTYLALAGHRQPGGRPLLQAGFRRLVGEHRWATMGAAARRRAGPPPVLGRHGPPGHRRPARHRDRAGPADGPALCPGPVRAGAGHDQLRHVHRRVRLLLGDWPGQAA